MTTRREAIPELLNNLNEVSFATLEQLYTQVMAAGTPQQKKILAEDGYLNHGSYMICDMAYGKLGYTDMEHLLVLVERAATLLGEELHAQEESIRYHMMIHCLHAGMVDRATILAQQCLALNATALAAEPEDPGDCHNQNALVYFALLNHDRSQSLARAQSAAAAIKAAAQYQVLEARWDIYLDILFCKLPELACWQGEELLIFTALAENYGATIPGFSYSIAQALRRLIDAKGNDLQSDIFSIYDSWLERAYAEPTFTSTYIEIIELVGLFASEGERLARLDFIDKAMANIVRIYGAQQDKCLALRIQVQCLEAKANIYRGEHNSQLAQYAIDQARHLCAASEAELAKDFSSQLFHAEFLLRYITFGEGSVPPTLAQIESLALSAREMGKGYYAAPALLLVELCLLQRQEAQAIYYLTQEFLLHELCLDSQVADLKQSVAPEFSAIHQLLDDFMVFSAEVRSGYYLDGSLCWEQVAKMSPMQVAEEWRKRMIAIRLRPPGLL